MRDALTRKRTYVDIETTVEVDITDLAEHGWHHEDDCPAKAAPEPPSPLPAIAKAIGSLHRQAHPSQHADPWLCREEPCRSLDGDLMRQAGAL